MQGSYVRRCRMEKFKYGEIIRISSPPTWIRGLRSPGKQSKALVVLAIPEGQWIANFSAFFSAWDAWILKTSAFFGPCLPIFEICFFGPCLPPRPRSPLWDSLNQTMRAMAIKHPRIVFYGDLKTKRPDPVITSLKPPRNPSTPGKKVLRIEIKSKTPSLSASPGPGPAPAKTCVF